MKGFTNKIWVFGAITTVLLIAIIMPSIPFSSAITTTICDSAKPFTPSIEYDDVLVRSGDTCNMRNAVINGNLYIESDARFTLSRSTVVGNIQADGPEKLVLSRVLVGGNIQVKNMDDDAGRVSLSLVGTALAPVGGNVELENNSGSIVQIERTIIAGNLEFIKNTSLSTNKIFDNTIGGSLDCGTENSEIGKFEGNVVTGAVTGQCVPLV